jgi:hypothetical protein
VLRFDNENTRRSETSDPAVAGCSCPPLSLATRCRGDGQKVFINPGRQNTHAHVLLIPIRAHTASDCCHFTRRHTP